jgi:hypothetical protein
MASPATSPVQYPAGSGLGVSVLLQQAHGFEGIFVGVVGTKSAELGRPNRPHVGEVALDDPLAATDASRVVKQDDDLVASLHEAHDPQGVVVEAGQVRGQEVHDVLSADAVVGKVRDRVTRDVQLEVRAEQPDNRRDISTSKGCIRLLNDLDVFFDIAYSERPTASRASVRSKYPSALRTLPARSV